MEFVLSELCEQVMTAYAGHKPLFICGGGTKAFYGNRHRTEVDGHSRLDITAYRGVVDYQPSELVVTVRAGAPPGNGSYPDDIDFIGPDAGGGEPFGEPRLDFLVRDRGGDDPAGAGRASDRVDDTHGGDRSGRWWCPLSGGDRFEVAVRPAVLGDRVVGADGEPVVG